MYRTYPELHVRISQIKASNKSQSLTAKSEPTITATPSTSSSVSRMGQPSYVTESDEVRALQKWQREQARLPTTGNTASDGAVYRMETGLDGKRYAVGADVRIDVTSGRTPREILTKAHTIQPAVPSSQVHSASAPTESEELQPSAATVQRDRLSQRMVNQYQSNQDSAQRTLATEA